MPNSNSYTKHIDIPSVLIYAVLVIFGWFNLYAANYKPDEQIFFSFDTEYFKQLVWIGVSLITISLIMLADSKIFVVASRAFYIASIVLLLVVLVAGKEVNGAKSWLALGPIQFQPVEFTKIGTALLLAYTMSRYNFSFKLSSYATTFGIILLPIVLVLLQNDTGSALIFFVFLLPMFREGMTPHILVVGLISMVSAIATLLTDNALVMAVVLAISLIVTSSTLVRHDANREAIRMVVATLVTAAALYASQFVTGHAFEPEIIVLISAVVMTVLLILIAVVKRIYSLWILLLYAWTAIAVSFATGYIFENVLIAHQRTRINVLFGIEDDPLGAGYNVNQSLIAIGSGGLTGKGFLEGTQTKLNFVPKQTTDFIFCTVGEEWGFVGTSLLVILYLTLFIRIILLAEKQHSVFSRVFGYCVASVFFFHFMVNICMAIGLMPVIGIPLPFFSYGGSSLWGFSVLLFIFLKLDTSRNELIR